MDSILSLLLKDLSKKPGCVFELDSKLYVVYGASRQHQCVYAMTVGGYFGRTIDRLSLVDVHRATAENYVFDGLEVNRAPFRDLVAVSRVIADQEALNLVIPKKSCWVAVKSSACLTDPGSEVKVEYVQDGYAVVSTSEFFGLPKHESKIPLRILMLSYIRTQ